MVALKSRGPIKIRLIPFEGEFNDMIFQIFKINLIYHFKRYVKSIFNKSFKRRMTITAKEGCVFKRRMNSKPLTVDSLKTPVMKIKT